VPVSVSIFSNVPEYDDKPIFICDSNPKKLTKYCVQTILKISLKAKSINENKYNHINNFLDAYINNNRNDLDKFKERNGSSNIYDDKQDHLIFMMIKILVNYENNVENATSLKISLKIGI
jgi:hypothetical protein